MKKTMTMLAAALCLLMLLLIGSAAAEGIPEMPTATPMPAETPSPEQLGKLQFVIDGPDEKCPITISYADFTEGKYKLAGLKPGTYTVTEVDPDKLLKDYSFLEQESVRTITVEVEGVSAVLTPEPSAEPTEGTAAHLLNVYERNATETPEPAVTETPVPDGDEKVIIPVVKVWDDFRNRDGNRPASVTVRLFADGNQVATAVLNSGNGWACEFTGLPRSRNGQEIAYTVTEDAVPLYTSTVEGFTITNHYTPVTTSATVRKVWEDNDNAAHFRPVSIYCTLSNGVTVILDEDNSWTATVENLPTVVNGKPVTYTWSEQEVIGYDRTGEETTDNMTVFTNTINGRLVPPPDDEHQEKKKRGTPSYYIDDYGTPLGVEVMINHVGDCFD